MKSHYPERLTGKQLLKLVQALHQQGLTQQKYEGGDDILPYNWHLLELPVQWLHAGVEFHEPTARRYAQMKSPMPPIIVNRELFVLDGFHRYHGARLQGQKKILVYSPQA